ncbi:MAG TPA: hypothetical protein VGB05_11215 [Pyrinomonadaceae bacterium]|jgi:hypothetical protein
MSDTGKLFEKVLEDKVRTIPDKARLIETARKKGRLLAVRGSMDYVEQVVTHVQTAEKAVVEAHRRPSNLTDFDVVFVGCPGRLNLSDWGAPLEAFLAAGGVLMTTDWCLKNFVQRLFPDTIRKRGIAQGTFPLRVLRPGHPLIEGIPDCEGTPWVVEAWSHRIEVLNPQRVEVVLDAPGMGGQRSAVLVNFNVGQGLVVHAISHFHLQGSKQSGEYVSAYILTNVIDEAMRRRHPTTPKGIRILNKPAQLKPQGMPLRIRVLKSS